MNKNKSVARSWQTVDHQHPRPVVDLGDLSGPAGNIFFMLAKIYPAMKSTGYETDRGELDFLIKDFNPNYNTCFDKIAYFVCLDEKPEPIDLNKLAFEMKESGDDVVFTVSKKDLVKRDEEIQNYEDNLYTTNLWNPKEMKRLLQRSNYDIEGDVGELNNLGRTALFYAKSLEDFQHIENGLLDSGYTTKEIEALLCHRDLAGVSALDKVLMIDQTHSGAGLRELQPATELLFYCINKYPASVDLSHTNTWGYNVLTQFVLVGDNLQTDIEKSKDQKSAMTTLIYFNQSLNALSKLTGYQDSLMNCGLKMKPKSSSRLFENLVLDHQKYVDHLQKDASKEMQRSYAEVSTQLEKTLLEAMTAKGDMNTQGKTLKI